MSLKWRKWVILMVIGLIPVLTGCEGCDKKHFAPSPAPSAPSSLSATVISLTRIDLTWKDNSTNEKGFYVYRKTTGNYSRIARLSPNATSYADSFSRPASVYRYKVTAYNDGGESGSSNEVSVKMVEILDYHMEEEYVEKNPPYVSEAFWFTEVIGHARNNTNQVLTIEIATKFINYADIVVYTAYDRLDDVKSGETWRFHLWCCDDRIKRVEVWVYNYY